MTLLVLSYCRARQGVDGNSTAMLDAHFQYVASHFENVLPGEPLSNHRPSACLCFDGGFYDFYATVFPLLKQHGLRAVLAVAPSVIRDRLDVPVADRINVASEAAYAHPASGAFCTWKELEEIAASGRVAFAAHGYSHRSLSGRDHDIETELYVPRTLLAARLGGPVRSFVFPHGHYTRQVLNEAKVGYDYLFANGDAANHGWSSRVIHRITADNLRSPTELFTPTRMLVHRSRAFFNNLRRN